MEYIVTASMHYRAMHLLTDDTANEQKLVAARQELSRRLGAMENSATGAELEILRKLQVANLNFGNASQRVDALSHAKDAGSMRVHLDEEHPLSHVLESFARDLIKLAGVRRDESLRTVEQGNRAGLFLLAGAGLGSVVLALFLGYGLSWSIVHPVHKLDEHMGRIARGELEEEISVPNRDELRGLVAKSNTMMQALEKARAELRAEHQEVTAQAGRLEELNRGLEERVASHVEELERTRKLSSYLAPQVVSAITSGRSHVAMENARKQLTMVFVDIRGFTAFSDIAEPEEVISILNSYLSAMTDLVFKYEGTLDKFLGDGMLVFFNDPLPQPDHAKRAVQMAVDMRDKTLEMQNDWRLVDTPLSIGIGITTGYVTVGAIGSAHRMEYTVIGRQVNLASRLVGVAEPNQIIISERTSEQVKDLVDVTEVGPLTVKGFQKPVTAYNVLRVNPK
jgi:class 3 adenylate cyclase